MRKSSCLRTFRRLPPLPPRLSPAAVASPPFHYRVLPPPLTPFRGPETPRFTSFLSSSSLSDVVHEQRAEDRNDFSNGGTVTVSPSNGSSSFFTMNNSSFSPSCSSSSFTTPTGVCSASPSSAFCAVAPTLDCQRCSEGKVAEREKKGKEVVGLPPSLPPPLSPLGMMLMVHIFPPPSSSSVVPTSLAPIPPMKTTLMVQVPPTMPHKGKSTPPRPADLPKRCRSTGKANATSPPLSPSASDVSSSFSPSPNRFPYAYSYRYLCPLPLSAPTRGVASSYGNSTLPQCRKEGRRRRRHAKCAIPPPRSHRHRGGELEEKKEKRTECNDRWRFRPHRRQMRKRAMARRKTSALCRQTSKRDRLGSFYSSSSSPVVYGAGGDSAASMSNPSLDKKHPAQETESPTFAGCHATENTLSGGEGEKGGEDKSASSSSSSSPPPPHLRPCIYTAAELVAALPYSSFILLYAALRRLGFEGLPPPPSPLPLSSSPLPVHTIGDEVSTKPFMDGGGKGVTVAAPATIPIPSSPPAKGESSGRSGPCTKAGEDRKCGSSRKEYEEERDRQCHRHTESNEEEKLVFFPDTVASSSLSTTISSSFVLPSFHLRAVKDAYRSLVKKLHPDLGGGDGAEMERINTAYQRVKRLTLVQQAAYAFWVSRKDGTRLIQEQEEEEGVDIMDMEEKEFVVPPASVRSTTQGTSADFYASPSADFFFFRSSLFSSSASTTGVEGMEMVFGCFYVTLFLSLLWWWCWCWKGKPDLYAPKTKDHHRRMISFFGTPSTTTVRMWTSGPHKTTTHTAEAAETVLYKQTVRYWLSFLFFSPLPPSPPAKSSLSIFWERCRNGVSEVGQIPEKCLSALLPLPSTPPSPAAFSFSSLWSFFFSFPQHL